MKRLISMILMLALLSCGAAIPTAVLADDDVQFTVTTVTDAEAGDEVVLELMLTGEYEAHAITLSVIYNTDELTLTSTAFSALYGDIVRDAQMNLGAMVVIDATTVAGQVKLGMLMPTTAETMQGQLLRLPFTVNEGVDTQSVVTVSIIDFFNMPVGETNPTPIPYTVNNGGVVMHVPVPVTGVVSTESMQLAIGGTGAIECVVAPENADNKAVTYASNDEDTATVSAEGVVTGVAAGETTITVTTDDGGFTSQTAVVVHQNCTVAYVADGETIVQYSIPWNTVFAEAVPAIPTIEGFNQTIPHWDTNLTGMTITHDYTVNAVYTINTYNVTYIADGAVVAEYTVDWNQTLSVIPTVPSKTGYDQTAPYWGLDLAEVPITQDYTVYAVYSANIYTVTYAANGSTVAEFTVEWNSTVPTIPVIPTVEGYDHTAPCWELDLEGVAITRNYTVNAVYTINTYTVTYTAEGETVARYTVDWNTALTEIPAVPEKPYFAGEWDTDLTGAAITQDITVNAVYTLTLLLGDVNADAVVNSADALLLLRYSLSIISMTEPMRLVGDVNFDGKYTSADALVVLRWTMEL